MFSLILSVKSESISKDGRAGLDHPILAPLLNRRKDKANVVNPSLQKCAGYEETMAARVALLTDYFRQGKPYMG